MSLLQAAKRGKVEVVKRLVERGADVNERDGVSGLLYHHIECWL